MFILLISLGAISASEYIDNQIDDTDSFVSESILSNENNVDDELMSISGNQVLENENIDDLNFKSSCEFNVLKEEGSDGNFTDLANEIRDTNDELNLNRNYIFQETEEYKNGILLNKSITVNGNGHYINGNNLSSLFYNNDSTNSELTFVFKDILFENFKTGANGAVFNFTNVQLKVINCSFVNNSATNGGAVSLKNVNVSFENCSFMDNCAINHISSMGGAIVLENDDVHNSSFSNCSFSNNMANYRGGAIFGSKISKINDCTFISNSVTNIDSFSGTGGALYLFYGCAVNNSQFINNYANVGNAIYLNKESYSFDNCIFVNSGANHSYIEATFTSSIAFFNCSFVSYGISCGDSYFFNCSFANKTSGDRGCIFSNGNCVVVNSSFVNNIANGDSGGAIHNGDAINCTFINNSARSGGALYYGDAINCTFINNSALKGSGGAIVDACDVINCTFENNFAGFDGAVCAYGNNKTIENCTFINNKANYDAGALNGGGSKVVNCTFVNNSAGQTGGAIYGGNPINCTFINNSASLGGGAICGGSGTIINCSFIENYSPTFGAAILMYNGLDMYNSTFSCNLADGHYRDYGMVIKNYGNGTIAYGGEDFRYNVVNCSGLINNDDKFKTKTIISASTVSMFYKEGKYLISTLKDGSGNPMVGIKISIKLNGKTYTKTTNNKGQVKLLLSSLIPQNYTATITYAGNNFYQKVSKSVKVVVKKATPKLSAANKAFKRKLRTKKYTVTLKNHKGTVLKSYKLTLRVKGKTFTAKTNSKGKATFKITNLSRKGTFKAVIKYAGNKYYKKISKTVKITAK